MAVLDKSLQALLKMAHKKLLWKNANTSSDFPGQTITVPNISKYDFYLMEAH